MNIQMFIPDIDLSGFCFSVVSAPRSASSSRPPLATNQLSTTNFHQPIATNKFPPTNCHQPIATLIVTNQLCHQLIVINQLPQQIVTNKLSSITL